MNINMMIYAFLLYETIASMMVFSMFKVSAIRSTLIPV